MERVSVEALLNPNELLDPRAVGRTSPNVVHPHDTIRINQHVAALLLRIGLRPAWQLPSEEFPEVRPPHGGAEKIPQSCLAHAMRVIQLATRIDDDRPAQCCLVGVRSGVALELERHDDNLNPRLGEPSFCFSHLHQVPTTRQSAQVPVEHQEQPQAAVVVEPPDRTVGVGQREWNRGLARQIGHAKLMLLRT
jgi:hypothetical protein